MSKPSRLHLMAALLAVAAFPAAAQTYAAGQVTATPLPPPSTALPHWAASTAPAPDLGAETKPDPATAATCVTATR